MRFTTGSSDFESLSNTSNCGSMSKIGLATKTLLPLKLLQNKFSGASRCNRRVRNQKPFKVMIVSWKSIRALPSYARLKGALRISVSSPPLMQNRHWRINNYSSRYLLCESLRARGKPSTMVTAGRTRREVVACEHSWRQATRCSMKT